MNHGCLCLGGTVKIRIILLLTPPVLRPPAANSTGVGRCCVQRHSRCAQKTSVDSECNCEVCLREHCFIRVRNLLWDVILPHQLLR